MTSNTITIELQIAWWFQFLYLPGVIAMLIFCRLINSNAQLDMGKFEYWYHRAVRIKVIAIKEGQQK
ncbi:hypothetical protein [Hahella ganghwensis]|uniref:hypothetical protein n=1 Tax=Hahella ganghwensis TaxID=286420 RepID=UPI00037B0E83|nr:hypothetical protein [Hahella ganghwensis]